MEKKWNKGGQEMAGNYGEKKSNLVNLASWSRRRGLMRNRCACRKGQVIGKVWNSVGEKGKSEAGDGESRCHPDRKH